MQLSQFNSGYTDMKHKHVTKIQLLKTSQLIVQYFVASPPLVSRKVVNREVRTEGIETIKLGTDEQKPYTIGRNQSANVRTLFDQAQKKGKLMLGVEPEWEAGQLLRVQF